MSTSYSNVIADIDTLLDTRQGVLSKLMSGEDLLNLITSESYLMRERDEFEGVDMAVYKQMYKLRDKLTISNSIVSYMFNVVKSKVVSIMQKANFNDDIKEVNLLVNFYPYKLSEKDTDMIIDVIFRKMEVNTHIKPIFKSPEELSPAYLNIANIEELFIYDTNRWINAHAATLPVIRIVKRSVHLPAILTNKISDEDLQKFKKTGFKDIHAYLEQCFSPMVSLDYMPIMFYGNIITVSGELDKLRKKNIL